MRHPERFIHNKATTLKTAHFHLQPASAINLPTMDEMSNAVASISPHLQRPRLDKLDGISFTIVRDTVNSYESDVLFYSPKFEGKAIEEVAEYAANSGAIVLPFTIHGFVEGGWAEGIALVPVCDQSIDGLYPTAEDVERALKGKVRSYIGCLQGGGIA